MAYLKVVVLLALIARTTQKPAHKSILDVDLCKNHQEIHGLSVVIGDVSLQGCGHDMSYKAFTRSVSVQVLYKKAVKDKLYLVLMYDADSPGCKSKLKFMMGNVDGKEISKGYGTSIGVVFANYNRPDESADTRTTHRYYIYVFEQMYSVTAEAFSTEDRCIFDVDKFIGGEALKLKAGTMLKTH